MTTRKLDKVQIDPFHTRDDVLNIAERVIKAKEAQIRRQRNTITRLVAGMNLVQTNATPEGGAVVLFKISDPGSIGGRMAVGWDGVFEVESVECVNGQVTITLKPEGP